VTGRKNEMIVTGGKNVNPFEVETAILKYPGIVEAAVFPVDDVEWGEIVCAAIVSSKKIDPKGLKIFLKNTLSSYKVPKKIFFEDVLPKLHWERLNAANLKKNIQVIRSHHLFKSLFNQFRYLHFTPTLFIHKYMNSFNTA
jgi:acyl-coenzyme A synthetase/AMP-(fatty) acid ligase